MSEIKPPKAPKYCLHRATNQAYVWIGKRNVYLGEYGSPKSEAAYRRIIAEWAATPRAVIQREVTLHTSPTVSEVVWAYWHHAKRRYVKNGKATSEQSIIWQAANALRALYGPEPAGRKRGRESLIDAVMFHTLARTGTDF